MEVYKLIEILKKCDPTAFVSFCYGENERADSVGFIEFNTTSNNIFLYEDEPSWDKEASDSHLEIDSITLIDKCFAETTYRDSRDEISA